MNEIAARRLAARRLTVIDATNLQRDNRRRYTELSKAHHAPLTAIVFDLPEKDCQVQNKKRGENASPTHVVRRHCRAVKQSLKTLSKEGYRRRYRLRTTEEVENATMEREPLSCDARDLKGPFDIIGDVHGCLPELRRMLEKLECEVTEPTGPDTLYKITPPEGRTAIFVGDLVDRGPDSAGVLQLVQAMANSGAALVVPGNHDWKLARALRGDRRTGELRPVELFVSVLGASSLTYAEATETQQLPDWVNAHIRMAEYFGGATTMWVPDQLKSAITRPCRYEPGVNRTYEDLAAHYGAVVIPQPSEIPSFAHMNK